MLRPKKEEKKGDRRTLAMGVIALGTVAAVAVAELGRVWGKKISHEETKPGGLISTAGEAVTETVAVAREGYRGISNVESTAFNLMSSFVISFGTVRATTYAIRQDIPPFRNVNVSGRHIHHFVPGLVVSFLSGVAILLTKGDSRKPLLAIPFGIGMGLVFDESALLLELEDVYWTREGLLSVQITLATAGILAATAYAVKIIRRGEKEVLESPDLG